MRTFILFIVPLLNFVAFSQSEIDDDIASIEPQVIQWRRDFHQNPELSNREFRTSEKIAEHLKSLGIEVQTGVAKTGVVGLLKGDHPGKVVALRADIDALPVTERNNLPFKSEVKATFLGTETGVMHACGHDVHMSILMGVAEVLSKHKHLIHGTVKFIFQPAEEGPPPGEEGGAKLMIKEGVLDNPKVDAIFGLHIKSDIPVGVIKYKTEGMMAAVERFVINVYGRQTHGSAPWDGVDPILISVKIIDGLQTIISREINLTTAPAVISVGKITSGTRYNIIPEHAELIGTVRTLDPEMKRIIVQRITEMAQSIAKTYGGEASVTFQSNTSITFNDIGLVEQMLPTLKRVIGEENVITMKPATGGEDFSYFQEIIPGFYFFLGSMTPGNMHPNPWHTPDFKIDERGMLYGVKALTYMAIDFLNK